MKKLILSEASISLMLGQAVFAVALLEDAQLIYLMTRLLSAFDNLFKINLIIKNSTDTIKNCFTEIREFFKSINFQNLYTNFCCINNGVK